MKVLIFSHGSDIDGMGSVVLSKLVFDKVDYVLSPGFGELEPVFRSYLESGKLDEYDRVYITDLPLFQPSLDLVANDIKLRDKVLIFDHHSGSLAEGCGIYDFENITEIGEDGKKTCGTELFYRHLCSKGYLKNNEILDEFVELTRLEDSWDWKEDTRYGIKAHELAILFNSFGDTGVYIDSMVNKLSFCEVFNYSDMEKKLIQLKKDDYEKVIKSYMDEAEYFVDEDGNKFCAVFAKYEYRNEITEYIERTGNPNDVEYAIIVALDRGANGKKSYRSISGRVVDLNVIAVRHGGGGHPDAASVTVSKEQKEMSLTLKKRDALEYLVNSVYSE